MAAQNVEVRRPPSENGGESITTSGLAAVSQRSTRNPAGSGQVRCPSRRPRPQPTTRHQSSTTTPAVQRRSTIAGALAGQLSVAQRLHAVHEHVPHALGEAGSARRPSLARRTRPGRRRRRRRARPRAGRRGRAGRSARPAGPSAGGPRPPGESSRSSLTMKRQNHDAHVYAPWKNDSGERAVRAPASSRRSPARRAGARTPRAAAPRSRRG